MQVNFLTSPRFPSWRFASPRFTSPRFASPHFARACFTSPVQFNPVYRIQYDVCITSIPRKSIVGADESISCFKSRSRSQTKIQQACVAGRISRASDFCGEASISARNKIYFREEIRERRITDLEKAIFVFFFSDLIINYS